MRTRASSPFWLGLVLAVWAVLVARFWWLCDDAFISFRYARNLANGHGLRYNLGDHTPVEGFSNLAWVLVATVVDGVSLDIPTVMPFVSAGIGLAVLLAVHHTLVDVLRVRELPALGAIAWLAWSAPMVVWSTSGLETMAWTALVFALALELIVRDAPRPVWTALWVVGLVTIRTEGIAWVVVCASGALVAGKRSRRDVGLVLGVTLVAFLVLGAGRLWWFESWVSNTARVKGSLGVYSLATGVPYLLAAALTLPATVVGVGLAAPMAARDARMRGLLWVSLAFPGMALAVGGDHFAFFRLLVPALPLVAVPLGMALDQRRMPALGGVLGAVSILALFGVDLAPNRLRRPLNFRADWRPSASERGHWDRQVNVVARNRVKGRAVAELGLDPERSWVVAALGVAGWESELFMLDANGLVTAEVAALPDKRGPVTPGHAKRVDKTFFFAHRVPDLFQVGVVLDRENAIRRQLRRWRPSVRQREVYAPRVHPLGDGRALVYLERKRPGEDTSEAWNTLAGRTGEVEAPQSGHFSRGPIDEERAQLDALGYLDGETVASDKSLTTVLDPGRAQMGRNLFVSGHAPGAFLTEMDGTVVHSWKVPFEKAFPDGKADFARTRNRGFWRRAKPVGDDGTLLAVFEFVGLLKVDARSRVQWSVANGAHHDFFVHGDAVWMLTRRSESVPEVSRRPVLEDFITVVDLDDGAFRTEISVLDALLASPFVSPADLKRQKSGDVLHTNALLRLDGPAASDAGPWKRGNLLLSSRALDALFVIDPTTASVVWFHRGAFDAQHDPRLLDDGSILLFDNLGPDAGSRVVRLNRDDGHVEWSWGAPDTPFFSRCCGTAAPLENGNVLIAETTGGRALEVTPDGAVVWEFYSPHRAPSDPTLVASLFDVVRLPSDYGMRFAPDTPGL